MTTTTRKRAKPVKLLDPKDELYALCVSEADRDWVRTCSWSVEAKKEYLIEERQRAFETAMQSAMAKEIQTLTDRVRKLEKELRGSYELIGRWVGKTIDKELKRLCVLRFAGTWESDTEYRRGDCVTHAGSLWCCIDTVKRSVPGKSADFKLIAKTGSAP